MNPSKSVFKFLVCLSILLPFQMNGQEESDASENKSPSSYYEWNNVIKLNSFGLVFNNASIFYERSIIPRLSGALGVGVKFSGKIPDLISNEDETLNIKVDPINGISLSPELRYYLKTCNELSPGGFYGGVYFRYTRYKTGTNIQYNPLNADSEILNGDLKMTERGIGIQLGYQLVFKDRFIVDFLFLGPRSSFMKIKGDFNNEISDDFKQEIENHVNNIIERLGGSYDFKLEDVDDTSLSGRFNIPNVRIGVSLGYSF